MKTTIFEIIIFGYGIGLLYSKAKKQHNPKAKGYNSDGSVKKHKIIFDFDGFTTEQIRIRVFYNHTFLIRFFY